MSAHPDSRWTHLVCAECYGLLEPGRAPSVVRDDDEDQCCLCGKDTGDGIYYRGDPVGYPFCRENPNP